MEIGHEDWHVRASELCFVGHIVALYGLRNEALKFLDLIVFEVVESLLEALEDVIPRSNVRMRMAAGSLHGKKKVNVVRRMEMTRWSHV